LAVYLHIAYLYRQAKQFAEMAAAVEKSFSMIE
jgi:hypothetical protein